MGQQRREAGCGRKKRLALVEVHVEDKNSGTMVNTKLSDSPINMVENGNKPAEKVERLEIDLNSDSTSVQSGLTGLKYHSSMANENSASHLLGSSNRSSEETASISIYRKSVDVLNQNTVDIFFLNFISQTLWNLRRFRDEFLKRRPVCSQSSHEGPCIADILYRIFSAWDKNDHHRTFYSLISLRDTICQILNDSNVFQKLQVERNISSDIVVTILNGLHMSEAFLHAGISSDGNKSEICRQAVNPANCRYCIFRAHDLFGMIFNKQMSCGCRTCFGEKEYTTVGNTLDADSPQTGKVKSVAENICEHCSLKNTVRFSSNTPDPSTIVLHWPSERENQGTLSEVIDAIRSDPIQAYYKGVYSTTGHGTKYALAAMQGYRRRIPGFSSYCGLSWSYIIIFWEVF